MEPEMILVYSFRRVPTFLAQCLSDLLTVTHFMKNLTLAFSLLVVLIAGCDDTDHAVNLSNQTTFFGDNSETFHTGTDFQRNTSYFYKRNEQGDILWSIKIPKSAEVGDQVIILSDGSTILYALGDKTYYKVSAAGTLLWSSVYESNHYAYVSGDHLWIPYDENFALGMYVVDLETGNQLSKIALPDLNKAELSEYQFSYHGGAVFLAAYIGYSHVELIKFDESGLLWRESNGESIDDFDITKLIHLEDGPALLFYNSILCKFNESGVFTERITLESDEDYELTVPMHLITNSDKSIEYFSYNPADLTKFIWNSIDKDGTLLASRVVQTPNQATLVVDHIFNHGGIVLSVFKKDLSAKNESHVLLKLDGTYEILQ